MGQKFISNQILLIKKMFKFYMNLIVNQQDPQIRERALKDISHSLFLIVQQFEHDENMLSSIANIVGEGFKQLTQNEQVTLLIDILSMINSCLFNIQKNFQKDSEEHSSLVIKLLHILPLISICSRVFVYWQQFSSYQKMESAFLMAEFWLFFVININILQSPKFVENATLNHHIDIIAMHTPCLLKGEHIIFTTSKLILLVQETPKQIYVKGLKRQYKQLFNISQFSEKDKVPLNEIIHCLLLKLIFQRRLQCYDSTNKSPCSNTIQYYGLTKKSFLEGFIVYLKEIGVNSKTLHSILYLVRSFCNNYVAIFRDLKLIANIQIKHNILQEDIQYLIEVRRAATSFTLPASSFLLHSSRFPLLALLFTILPAARVSLRGAASSANADFS